MTVCPDCNEEVTPTLIEHAMERRHTDLADHLTKHFARFSPSCHYCAMEQEDPSE